MNNFDKFLKVTMWAARRYRNAETGLLVLSHGTKPTIYSEIETLAWKRYITHASDLK
jgi:hypothetical protein